MNRILKWTFALPLAYITYLVLAMLVPSGTSETGIMLRNTVLHIILSACVLLYVKYMLNFNIRHFLNRNCTFSIRRMFTGLTVMFLTGCLTTLIWKVVQPDFFTVTFNKAELITDWTVSALLIICAAFSEELIFRCYIAYFLKNEPENNPRRMWRYCTVSAILFTIAHFENPEVNGKSALYSMTFYFIMGFTLMLFMLQTGGCEFSLGVHIGNNLVSAWLCTYNNTVIHTNAIFTQHNAFGPFMLIQTALCLLVCSLVLNKAIERRL
ncbi:MAG: CPBP family intramembrane metalloprotease [Sphaerochaetaceae bacterium]|nr:CPBP family intramembrane metalloprotease [Sphaerochaetaceae bacterium]